MITKNTTAFFLIFSMMMSSFAFAKVEKKSSQPRKPSSDTFDSLDFKKEALNCIQRATVEEIGVPAKNKYKVTETKVSTDGSESQMNLLLEFNCSLPWSGNLFVSMEKPHKNYIFKETVTNEKDEHGDDTRVETRVFTPKNKLKTSFDVICVNKNHVVRIADLDCKVRVNSNELLKYTLFETLEK